MTDTMTPMPVGNPLEASPLGLSARAADGEVDAGPARPDANHLRVEWEDPTGSVWHLTEGTEGVLLATDQEGLNSSEVEHTYVRGDSQWAGSVVKRAEPDLRVEVGYGLAGDEYYRLADRWWSVANSTSEEGVLRITRPDGVVRELRCRLRTTPGTTWAYDPGAGLADAPTELWPLTSSQSYWEGPEQSIVFGAAAVGGDGGALFYGPEGHGWPLNIAATSSAHDLFISNRGQGPQWLTWTLIGPISSIQFGVGDGILAYSGGIAAGEQIVVTTEPGYRYVQEIVSGENRYTHITGHYAPAPVGEQIPLHIVAEGMTDQSSVIVTAREQYLRPF